VPDSSVEAARSLGSTRFQVLRKVQLPLARRTIGIGVNQTIMMALSMVVITAVIGAPGLGADVLRALQQVNVGLAFQAGAQAYLLKSASPAVVTDGVKRVLDGGVYADPTVAPLLATGTRVPGTDNTPRELSAREVEVLQLVADGQSNKEIGEALSLSALTVKSHLSRIGRKLGTGDRAQMVALAMRAGVIR